MSRFPVLMPPIAASRSARLLPLYQRLVARMEGGAKAARTASARSADSVVPHPQLRGQLLRDPAMAALLASVPGCIALGGAADAPFLLHMDLILLPPALLDDAASLAVAARWGLEAALALEGDCITEQQLGSVLRHGAALIDALDDASASLLLDLLPAAIAQELRHLGERMPSAALIVWQAGRLGEARTLPSTSSQPDELEGPLERLLIAGGDSRLRLDPRTGCNRYGVPPRPRPEAVHFSSSTASAVSEYGFLYCDLLRHHLLAARRDGVPGGRLRRAAAHALGVEITRLLGLDDDEVDVALTPSGTDAELLSVAVARAGAGGRPLANLLMAPDESGRGVRLAGSGCWFDDVAGTGAPIARGQPVWPEGEIPVHEIAIRDGRGHPRSREAVDADFLRAGTAALESGNHLLAHVLLTSKTGMSAPSHTAVDQLVALAPGRVDVVVDACQMRTPFSELGAYARRGWMLQVSGSKFLTGPPFSGALVVPASMCGRAAEVGRALLEAPGIGHATDWTERWSGRMNATSTPLPSFGAILRWVPALLEAELLGALPEAFRRDAFKRFREALAHRLDRSPYLQPIDVGDALPQGRDDAFARLSIMSFQVRGRRSDGRLETLGETGCRSLFETLNRDATDVLTDLSPVNSAVARQAAHIGQAVTLGSGAAAVTVLRMVLGARFFSIVGYAGAGAVEAALQSEIADAERAIDKLELLAEHWWRLDTSEANP